MSPVVRMTAIWCGLMVAGAGYLNVQAGRPQATAAAARARQQPAAAARTVPQPEPPHALIDTYCVSCHSARVKTAGLALDEASRQTIAANPQIWEKVVRKLRAGAMPPVGRPRPGRAARHLCRRLSLETALDRAAAADPNPGRPVIHRLNRAEYGNAIRDLLALEIDARALLPADDTDQRVRQHRGRAVGVAGAAGALHVGGAQDQPARGRASDAAGSVTYQLGGAGTRTTASARSCRSGRAAAWRFRTTFPADGEYAVRIKLQTNIYDYIPGSASPRSRRPARRRAPQAIHHRRREHGRRRRSAMPATFSAMPVGDLRARGGRRLEAGFRRRPAGGSSACLRQATWEPEGVLQPRQTGNRSRSTSCSTSSPASTA